MNIKIGTYEFNTPDGWNELPINLLQPAYLILKADDIPPVTRLSELTKLLLDVGDGFLTQWREWCVAEYGVEDGEAIWSEDWSKVVTAVTYPFIESVESANGSTRIKYQIDLSFTKCVYPVLNFQTKAGMRKLYACKGGFKNMSIGELARVDTYVQNYLTTGDVQYINQCIALIYREHKENTKQNRRKGYDGDVREKMQHVNHNERKREKMAAELLTENGRKILWFWITSCREKIFRKWKHVLNPDVGSKKTYWEKQLSKFGWAGLFIELASSSSITENDVADLNHEDVFVKLAYLETKRKAEKAASKTAA